MSDRLYYECEYCGYLYASKEKECPKCGAPRNVSLYRDSSKCLSEGRKVKKKSKNIVTGSIVSLAVVFAVIFSWYSFSKTGDHYENNSSSSSAEKENIQMEGTNENSGTVLPNTVTCLSDMNVFSNSGVIIDSTNGNYNSDNFGIFYAKNMIPNGSEITRSCEFCLNKEYSSLNFQIYVPNRACQEYPENIESAVINVYQDNMLTDSYAMNYKDRPLAISLNIRNTDFLKIEFITPKSFGYKAVYPDYAPCIAIGNANLSKEIRQEDIVSTEDNTYEFPKKMQVNLTDNKVFFDNNVDINTSKVNYNSDNFGTYYTNNLVPNGYDITTHCEYCLNKDYSKLSFSVYVPAGACQNYPENIDSAKVNIYGDDILIGTYSMTYKDRPVQISMDIKDVDFLKIEFVTPKSFGYRAVYPDYMACLAIGNILIN